MPFMVVVSTVSTGRVHRRHFHRQQDAVAYAERFRPCGRRHEGYRVEIKQYRVKTRS